MYRDLRKGGTHESYWDGPVIRYRKRRSQKRYAFWIVVEALFWSTVILAAIILASVTPS